MLYHDMTNSVMIQLAPDDQTADDFKNFILSSAEIGGLEFVREMNSTYQYRVVRDINKLREKALIFSLGLDDRIIELAKFISSALFQNKYPGHKVLAEYFTNEPSFKVLIVLEDDNIMENALSMDLYTGLGEKYQIEIENKSKDCYFIDHDWAQIVLLGT